MRISTGFGLGAALIVAVSLSAWAQDQPAAGSPPPDASAQAPAQQRTAPAEAQPAPEQNAAPAQGNAPSPPDARRRPNPRRQARMLAGRLDLTPGQQAEIEPILVDHQQRIRRARTDATLTPLDRRARVREINHDSARRINAVLTLAQRREYKQLRREQRAWRLEREQQQRPAPASNPQ